MALPPTWELFGDDHLPHRLQLLAKMIDRQTARQLQQSFGVSLAEWRVLAFVCAAGPASAARIASDSAIDRAEVSRAVARLERQGMIVRATDPGHRRRLIVGPSGEGRELFARIGDRRRAYFEAIMRDIPAEQRRALNDGLRMLALGVAALQPEAESHGT